jgi:hypothetical protein
MWCARCVGCSRRLRNTSRIWQGSYGRAASSVVLDVAEGSGSFGRMRTGALPHGPRLGARDARVRACRGGVRLRADGARGPGRANEARRRRPRAGRCLNARALVPALSPIDSEGAGPGADCLLADGGAPAGPAACAAAGDRPRAASTAQVTASARRSAQHVGASRIAALSYAALANRLA